MHEGRMVARKGKWKIIDCKRCKFRHLYPLPSAKKLREFYRKQYFECVRKGKRNTEMKRLITASSEGTHERNWLNNTLYEDIYCILKKYTKNSKHLVDIGCGTGHFLSYMKKNRWKVIGIEPGREIGNIEKGLENLIYKHPLEDFIIYHSEYESTFDTAVLMNVLEHVLDPRRFLEHVKKLLKPCMGLVCIRVPNDFSQLQKYASDKIKKTLWWMTVPDHINYFSRYSLERLLYSMGFDIAHVTADFPMELFLLLGDNYVGNPQAGKICHKKRIDFELSISGDLRRKIYQRLAQLDIGRNITVFARLSSET